MFDVDSMKGFRDIKDFLSFLFYLVQITCVGLKTDFFTVSDPTFNRLNSELPPFDDGTVFNGRMLDCILRFKEKLVKWIKFPRLYILSESIKSKTVHSDADISKNKCIEASQYIELVLELFLTI